MGSIGCYFLWCFDLKLRGGMEKPFGRRAERETDGPYGHRRSNHWRECILPGGISDGHGEG